MSAASHLKIIAAFDRWTQGGQSPAALLADALPLLKAMVPETRGLRLYHLNQHAVLVGAATDSDTLADARPIQEHSPLAKSLASRQPVYEDGRWWVPLASFSTTFGLLEVLVDPNETPTDSAFETCSEIAIYLSQALEARTLRELVYKQAQVSGALTQASNFLEIAQILARHLLGPGQFLTIGQFSYDDNGTLVSFKVVATANRSQTYPADAMFQVRAEDGFGERFNQMIENPRPTLTPDIRETNLISADFANWLASFGIRGICSLPMRAPGRLYGVISLNDSQKPMYVSEAQMAVFQSLADQVSTLVQFGRLAEISDYAYAISEGQKAAFAEMVSGQTYAEMVAIIARHMLPQSGRYLGISELILDGKGKPRHWRLHASANRERVYRWELDFPVLWEELSPEMRQAFELNEPFIVENLEDATSLLGEPLFRWMKDNDTKALLNVPIRLNNRLLALISVLSRTPTVFTREEVNAFGNLANQMGALISVRQLIEQARIARNVVDNLALANRLVTTSRSYADMAQGVMYTLGRTMTAVVLTLFDEPVTRAQQPRKRQIVAVAYPENDAADGEPVARPDPLTEEPLTDVADGELLSRLWDAPLYADDATLALPEQTLAQYGALGAQWAAIFALDNGSQMLGTLDILNRTPYVLSQDELDSYSTIAGQIAITILSRRLLEESRSAQELAAQLVNTNRTVAMADGYDEMALAIINALPASIVSCAIMLFDEPALIDSPPSAMNTVAVASHTGIEEIELFDVLPQMPDMGHERWIVRLLNGELMVVEDIQQSWAAQTDTARYFYERGINSYAISGLQVGIRLIGVLAFGAQDSSAFRGLQLDNLRAMSGQVAVAVENRSLIHQTADALSFVAEQYETSLQISRTRSLEDLLLVAHRFADAAYHRAFLGLLEGTSIRVLAAIQEGRAWPDHTTFYALPNNLDTGDGILTWDGNRRLLFLLPTSDVQLTGIVAFENPTPVTLSSNRVLALRSLAEQIIITTVNRILAQRTEDNLRETVTLYDVNRLLISSDGALDVLGIIKGTLATEANSLALISVQYDSEGSIHSFLVNALVETRADEESRSMPRVPISGGPLLKNFQAKWARQGSELDFVANVENTSDLTSIANPALLYLNDRGTKVRSAIVIPVFYENRLAQQILIAFDQAQVFDEAQKRLYTAVRDQVEVVLSNQRLLDELRDSADQLERQVRVLETLNQFSTQLAAIANETELMQIVTRSVVNGLGVDHAGIVLMNAVDQAMSVVGDYPKSNLLGLRINSDDPVQQRIRFERAPILVRNLEDDQEFGSDVKQALLNQGIRAMLLLPLIDLQNRYIGSLGLDSYSDASMFSPEVQDAARAMAAQATISLQNLRQLAFSRHQAEQLQQLASFSQMIQLRLDTPSILNTVLIEVPKMLSAKYISVFLYNFTQERLVLTGMNDNGKISEMLNLPMDLGRETAAGLAWTQRNLVYSPDVHEIALHHSSRTDALSIMAAPIQMMGTEVGVVEIADVRAYSYSDTDQLIFRQIATQVGIAIENTQAYEQSQRLARSKTLANLISSQLQQQIDIERVLNTTISELGQVLKARKARIRLGTSVPGEKE